MKKLSTLLLGLCLVLLAACSANTPAKVAEKAMGYMADGEMDKFVEMIYVDPDATEEETAQGKEFLTALFKSAYESTVKSHGGYKDFKVTGEKVDEKAGTAEVEMEVTYKDGTTDDENFDLRKDQNGDWKIYLHK